MTTLLTTYSFMDLLKDYNYVPKTDQNETSYISTFTNVFKKYTAAYGFMDLLRDNNYVPQSVEDNTSIIVEIENGFNSIVDFVEENTSDYSFMDLLHDKGYVPNLLNAPLFASNDNDIILQEAS